MKKPTLDGITLKVEVQFIKQGDFIIAYSPALELSTYSDTEEGAKIAFEEAVDIFLEDTVEKGTLLQVLSDLGWKIPHHSRSEYKQPSISAKNPKLSHVYSTTNVEVRVPACL